MDGISQRLIQLVARDIGVRHDKREHRRHVGMNHPRALRNAGDADTAFIGCRDFGNRVRRHDASRDEFQIRSLQ
jgi:hypothetical protein